MSDQKRAIFYSFSKNDATQKVKDYCGYTWRNCWFKCWFICWIKGLGLAIWGIRKVSSTSSQLALPCVAWFDVCMFSRLCGRWSGGVPRAVVVVSMTWYLSPPIHYTGGEHVLFLAYDLWYILSPASWRRPKSRPKETPCSIAFFSGVYNR